MKGKDRERAYLATIRSNLARFNFTKFKNVVDAFNFYDKVNKNSLNFILFFINFIKI